MYVYRDSEFSVAVEFSIPTSVLLILNHVGTYLVLHTFSYLRGAGLHDLPKKSYTFLWCIFAGSAPSEIHRDKKSNNQTGVSKLV